MKALDEYILMVQLVLLLKRDTVEKESTTLTKQQSGFCWL